MWGLISLAVKWVFLRLVSSPESHDDSLGNCKIRMSLLTVSCGLLIALFIANQIISLDMHQGVLIAYEISALLHRNQMSFSRIAQVSLQPQYWRGKEKKGKKPQPFRCVAQQQNLRGKQSRNEGMSISKRTGYFRQDIRDKQMSPRQTIFLLLL